MSTDSSDANTTARHLLVQLLRQQNSGTARHVPLLPHVLETETEAAAASPVNPLLPRPAVVEGDGDEAAGVAAGNAKNAPAAAIAHTSTSREATVSTAARSLHISRAPTSAAADNSTTLYNEPHQSVAEGKKSRSGSSSKKSSSNTGRGRPWWGRWRRQVTRPSPSHCASPTSMAAPIAAATAADMREAEGLVAGVAAHVEVRQWRQSVRRVLQDRSRRIEQLLHRLWEAHFHDAFAAAGEAAVLDISNASERSLRRGSTTTTITTTTAAAVTADVRRSAAPLPPIHVPSPAATMPSDVNVTLEGEERGESPERHHSDSVVPPPAAPLTPLCVSAVSSCSPTAALRVVSAGYAASLDAPSHGPPAQQRTKDAVVEPHSAAGRASQSAGVQGRRGRRASLQSKLRSVSNRARRFFASHGDAAESSLLQRQLRECAEAEEKPAAGSGERRRIAFHRGRVVALLEGLHRAQSAPLAATPVGSHASANSCDASARRPEGREKGSVRSAAGEGPAEARCTVWEYCPLHAAVGMHAEHSQASVPRKGAAESVPDGGAGATTASCGNAETPDALSTASERSWDAVLKSSAQLYTLVQQAAGAATAQEENEEEGRSATAGTEQGREAAQPLLSAYLPFALNTNLSCTSNATSTATQRIIVCFAAAPETLDQICWTASFAHSDGQQCDVSALPALRHHAAVALCAEADVVQATWLRDALLSVATPPVSADATQDKKDKEVRVVQRALRAEIEATLQELRAVA